MNKGVELFGKRPPILGYATLLKQEEESKTSEGGKMAMQAGKPTVACYCNCGCACVVVGGKTSTEIST